MVSKTMELPAVVEKMWQFLLSRKTDEEVEDVALFDGQQNGLEVVFHQIRDELDPDCIHQVLNKHEFTK